MKPKEIVLDGATVVGCCVGVGFLSGKEAQLYFGNTANVVIFALCFALLNILVRNFCASKNCFAFSEFSDALFGKFGKIFSALFCLCCFVCVVTMLAGVEKCLGDILFRKNFPCFAMGSALVSALILKKGLNALKWLNVVSLTLAALCVVILAVSKGHLQLQNVATPPVQPVKYALFSVTMSLGVLTPLSRGAKGKNVAATAVATATLCVLVVLVLALADFSQEMPLLGKTNSIFVNILNCVAMSLATVTGVVANTMPILDCVDNVFDRDKTLAAAVVLTLAVAFSLFGFDFALRYGYLFVATVGIVIFVALCVHIVKSWASRGINSTATPRKIKLKHKNKA